MQSSGTDRRYASSTDAVIRGVGVGLQVALNVGASLIVFVALVSLADRLLAILPGWGGEPVSVERVLGLLFTPLAWCIGGAGRARPPAAGRLLGIKLVLTEFSAFIALGKTPASVISDHTRMILTYAICGFANSPRSASRRQGSACWSRSGARRSSPWCGRRCWPASWPRA